MQKAGTGLAGGWFVGLLMALCFAGRYVRKFWFAQASVAECMHTSCIEQEVAQVDVCINIYAYICVYRKAVIYRQGCAIAFSRCCGTTRRH